MLNDNRIGRGDDVIMQIDNRTFRYAANNVSTWNYYLS